VGQLAWVHHQAPDELCRREDDVCRTNVHSSVGIADGRPLLIALKTPPSARPAPVCRVGTASPTQCSRHLNRKTIDLDASMTPLPSINPVFLSCITRKSEDKRQVGIYAVTVLRPR
jgi:hypothetical protein